MSKRPRMPRSPLKKFILMLVLAAGLSVGLAAASSGDDSHNYQQQGILDGIIGDIGIIGDLGISFDVTYTIDITTFGNGAGTVTSNVNGDDTNPLSCSRSIAGVQSGDCSDPYTFSLFLANFNVTLTATPAPGSTFAGWTGECAGVGPEVVDLVAMGNVACGATFTTDATFPLAVTTAGPGNGTVTAPGINCTRMNGLQSGDCLESYAAGSLVNVAATAGTGFTFDGFSGDCTGNTCSLTMNAARSVTASFGAVTFPLTVDVQGTGAGIVVSTSHPGIVCAGNAGTDGGDCSESYAANTVVTLQATPSTGSTFTGSWGGACAAFGTNPTCTVTMSAAQAVTASFTLGGGGGGGACTITGTAGADVLNGTAGADVICGKGGNDVINGKGGNDTLKGDKGADVISGGNGADKLFGGKGADVLKGGKGADTANGGNGVDICTAEVKISCP